jgi:segregation and condensation protein B
MQHHPLRRFPAAQLPLARPAYSLPRPLRSRRVRLDPQEPGPSNRDELARDRRLAEVEAALIASDEPLSLRRLITVAGLNDTAEARKLLGRLGELYHRDGTAFQVAEVAGGFQLQTRPEFHPWLARLRRGNTELRLTPAARETLTIVAYREPITRADIEGIRGVQCAEVLRQLMEKGLLRIAGRDDSLGRPQLFRTTKKFLQVFGLNRREDLPLADRLLEKGQKPARGKGESTGPDPDTGPHG